MKIATYNLLSFPATVFLFFLVASGCKKEDKEPRLPVMTTVAATNILLNTAESGGVMTSGAGLDILQKGVCWSTNQVPTILDFKTVDGSDAGSFSSKLTGLTPDETYYVRAYANTPSGVGYGNIVSIKTLNDKLADNDNNVYSLVQIGNHIWMAENLKTTRYNDGALIPHVITGWGTSNNPAYCWHSNDEASNKDVYGALYNWHVVNSGKLCPPGWRVPTDDDWNTLVTELGGQSVAGSKMKETGTTYWKLNSDGNNSSGFSARPAGQRYAGGDFYLLGYDAYWWSANEAAATKAFYWTVFVNNTGIMKNQFDKTQGLSVRLVKE
jgi:uncharacterized protein (TIGR02145 family)